MRMTLKQFLNKHCQLHDDYVTYDDSKKSFNLLHFSDRSSRGIYFFAVDYDILKVGMADGATGFYSRFSKYNCDNTLGFAKGRSDPVSMYNCMQKVYKKYGKKVVMQVWVHKMTSDIEDYHGFKVASSKIRGFEYEMSHFARAEGHSMFLSKLN